MAPQRAPITSRQPVKALWILGALITTIIRLPVLLIYYIPKSLRPHPEWTYRQSLLVDLIRSILYNASIIRLKTPPAVESSSNKGRFVHIQPATAAVYQGVLQATEVKPATISGTWYPSIYTPKDESKRVILHFHGGAFVVGSSQEIDSGFGMRLLAKHAAAKVLAVEYRLSSNPGGQFPACLQDAVSSYKYLLDQGIMPSNIALSGDSAGGNIVVGLLRYLSESGDILPNPGAALLWSPWLDLEKAANPEYLASSPRFGTDYLSSGFAIWGLTELTSNTFSLANPYITPAHRPFATKVPIWIHVGGLEVLYDEDLEFAEDMKTIQGNIVEVHIESYTTHDLIMTADRTGFEEEAIKATKLVGDFLTNSGL